MPKKRTDPTHCYIGRMACGCVVAVRVDDPDRLKATAKDVAEFIREGYAVERVTLEQFRTMHLGCIHENQKQPETLFPGFAPEHTMG